MKRKLLLLIIIMIAVAGCGSDEPCSVQSADYFYEVDRLQDKVMRLAGNSFLSEFEQVDELEMLLEEAKELDAPRCAQEVQTNFVKFFEAAVSGAKAEVSGDVSKASKKERETEDHLDAYFIARVEIEVEDLFDE